MTKKCLYKGPFPCMRICCVSVCMKKWLLTYRFRLFPCVRDPIGLRDVSVVRETESLQERFFHALRTLRTANCTLFNVSLVEFFDKKTNIANNNDTELFT